MFAREPIAAGRVILVFAGTAVDRATVVTQARDGGHDDFLQIDDDRFLGRSATADDYLNHSCDPNAWVRITRIRASLIALHDIPEGGEIRFDYGLTQVDFPFRFHCRCGSHACRGDIGNYDELPPDVLARYRAIGAIPRHVVRRLRRQRAAPVAPIRPRFVAAEPR